MAKISAELEHRLSCARTDRAKHQGPINDFLRLADALSHLPPTT